MAQMPREYWDRLLRIPERREVVPSLSDGPMLDEPPMLDAPPGDRQPVVDVREGGLGLAEPRPGLRERTAREVPLQTPAKGPELRDLDVGPWRRGAAKIMEMSPPSSHDLIEKFIGGGLPGSGDFAAADLPNISGFAKEASNWSAGEKGYVDSLILAMAGVPVIGGPAVKGAKAARAAFPGAKKAAGEAASAAAENVGHGAEVVRTALGGLFAEKIPAAKAAKEAAADAAAVAARTAREAATDAAAAAKGAERSAKTAKAAGAVGGGAAREGAKEAERALASSNIDELTVPRAAPEPTPQAMASALRGGEPPPMGARGAGSGAGAPPAPPGGGGRGRGGGGGRPPDEPPGPPPGIGHNQPPESIWDAPSVDEIRFPRQGEFTNMTDVPDIRRLSVEEATARAKHDPHLIEGGAGTAGLYVGGPRNIRSKRALSGQRGKFDRYVAADPRGGDWYDRYRVGLNETTGGHPEINAMQSGLHGQLSAGVDPGTETAMALRFNNMALRRGGDIPQGQGAAYGRMTNRERFKEAIDRNDPSELARGDKTSEYALRINPDNQVEGATGVNDFRYMKAWGFRNPDGSVPAAGNHPVGSSYHKFLDYETAKAVARANAANLGGRSNWTGEQLQAAPWVRQKAIDLQKDGGKKKDGTFKITYEEAFARANQTYKEYLDKFTVNVPTEQTPGFAANHLRKLHSDPGARQRYHDDPRSRENIVPAFDPSLPNRDAFYDAIHLPDARGVAFQHRPTIPGQGAYRNKSGVFEYNPSEVVRPMAATTVLPDGSKGIDPESKSIIELVETMRSLLNAQEMTGAHMNFPGGRVKDVRSIFIPGQGKASEQQMRDLITAGEPHGLTGASDTGRGALLTRWGNFDDNGNPVIGGKAIADALRKPETGLADEIQRIFPGSNPAPVGTDSSIFIDWSKEMAEGSGSGAMTRKFLAALNAEPEIAAMLNRSEYIPQIALNKLQRDLDAAAGKFATNAPPPPAPGVRPQDAAENERAVIGANGGPSIFNGPVAPDQYDVLNKGIQNIQRIIGEGPNWQARLQKALDEGKVELASVALALLGLGAALQPERQQTELDSRT
jgi:hypothetical protein